MRAAPPDGGKDTEARVATAETRIEVTGYPASFVVPSGWGYLNAGAAAMAQTTDRGAGLILFGARDLPEVEKLLAKLRESLALVVGDETSTDDTVTIGGATFERVAYPRSTLKTHPASVTIGVTRLEAPKLVVFLSYVLSDQPESAEALAHAVESIRVRR